MGLIEENLFVEQLFNGGGVLSPSSIEGCDQAPQSKPARHGWGEELAMGMVVPVSSEMCQRV